MNFKFLSLSMVVLCSIASQQVFSITASHEALPNPDATDSVGDVAPIVSDDLVSFVSDYVREVCSFIVYLSNHPEEITNAQNQLNEIRNYVNSWSLPIQQRFQEFTHFVAGIPQDLSEIGNYLATISENLRTNARVVKNFNDLQLEALKIIMETACLIEVVVGLYKAISQTPEMMEDFAKNGHQVRATLQNLENSCDPTIFKQVIANLNWLLNFSKSCPDGKCPKDDLNQKLKETQELFSKLHHNN